MKTKQLYIRLRSSTTGQDFAPPELRERLVADANEQGTNLTEIAIAILAKRVGYNWEPIGRKASPILGSDNLKLNLPADLDRMVRVAASSAGSTPQHVALLALCEHYGLDLPEPVKRGRPAAARDLAAA